LIIEGGRNVERDPTRDLFPQPPAPPEDCREVQFTPVGNATRFSAKPGAEGKSGTERRQS